MYDPLTASFGNCIMIFIAVGVPCGLFCMWLAGKKGHNEGAWFFGGLAFNILALITIAGAPDRREEKRKADAEKEAYRSSLRTAKIKSDLLRGMSRQP